MHSLASLGTRQQCRVPLSQAVTPGLPGVPQPRPESRMHTPGALVYLCLRAVRTKHHRLGGLNNRDLFFTILEAGSPSSECQQSQILVRGFFLAFRQMFHIVCSHGLFSTCVWKKRVNKLSGTLLTKALSPLDQDTFTTSSNPYHIPKHYFQIPSFWGHRT